MKNEVEKPRFLGRGAATEQVITITNPPPSANRIWRSVNGKVLKSKDYRTWAAAAAWEVLAQKPKKYLDDVAVMVELRRPTSRSDIDNRVKPCLDMLTGIVWPDDRQVVDIRARWADIDGCRITIRPASDE